MTEDVKVQSGDWSGFISQQASFDGFRHSVRDSNELPPDLPRSIAWYCLLLFEDLDLSSWPSRQSSLRGAYQSLRDHFIRNDDEDGSSGTDPLSSDYEASLATSAQEKELRREILQDVERCMPDMTYFDDPEVMRIMCDVLFVYAKLNADVGYRQGMHEILAPVVWTIAGSTPSQAQPDAGSVVSTVSDKAHNEHDIFSLFTKIMSIVKPYYEWSPGSTSSSRSASRSSNDQQETPLVQTCNRIWTQLLPLYDPELSQHLTDCHVSHQIFLLRWIRLLFSREFAFDATLSLWDHIFAEEKSFELVEYICIAMLLRVRWELLSGDDNDVLKLLLHYPTPEDKRAMKQLVDDAAFLKTRPETSTGRQVILRRSGRQPANLTAGPERLEDSPIFDYASLRARRDQILDAASRTQLGQSAQTLLTGSPSRNLNRFVRGALSEVTKNVQNISSPSRPSTPNRRRIGSEASHLEDRNTVIAALLSQAINDIQVCEKALSNESPASTSATASDILHKVLLQIQVAQSCLVDSSLPLPSVDKARRRSTSGSSGTASSQPEKRLSVSLDSKTSVKSSKAIDKKSTRPVIRVSDTMDEPSPVNNTNIPTRPPTTSSVKTVGKEDMDKDNALRPSLTQSSYSWMLDQVHEGPFATATTFAPTEKRQRHTREKSFLFGEDVDLNDPLNAK